MIEILPAPIHVAAFRLSGMLTAEDYDQITGAVDAKMKEHHRVAFYTEAQELSGIEPEALAKDVKYAFGKLGEFHRFPRGAIVTDKPWLRAIATLGNSVVRTTELRTFGTGERVAAMKWVAEVHDEPHTPALRVIPTTRADTLAFAWNGTIASDDAAELVKACERVLERSERIRLLGRIERLGGLTPAALLRSGLFKFKWRARHRVERYAVVGGPSWLARWVVTVRGMFAVEIRHFELSDEGAAWAWIEAEPASTG
jgi:SpoIIAA-like